MEEKEFASVVVECEILSKPDIGDLMRYFNSVLDTSVGFFETKRAGLFEKISRFPRSLAPGWHYIYGLFFRVFRSYCRQKHKATCNSSFW